MMKLVCQSTDDRQCHRPKGLAWHFFQGRERGKERGERQREGKRERGKEREGKDREMEREREGNREVRERERQREGKGKRGKEREREGERNDDLPDKFIFLEEIKEGLSMKAMFLKRVH